MLPSVWDMVQQWVMESAMSNNAQSCITSASNVASYTGIRVTMDAGVVKSAISSSPQRCIISTSNVAQDTDHGAAVDVGGPVQSAISKCSKNEASSDLHVSEKGSSCNRTGDCGSANSAVQDGDDEPKAGESGQNSSSKIVSVQGGDNKINANRNREALKRRRWDRTVNKKVGGSHG